MNQCVKRSLRDLTRSLPSLPDIIYVDFYESDTGCMPAAVPETKYEHDGKARLMLPPSRLSLEEKIQYTQILRDS